MGRPRVVLPGAALALLVATTTLGCGGDELSCVEVDLACQPLYPPVFEQVFSQTLQPKCGVAGGACHSRDGRKAGLVLDDRDEAYQRLVEDGRVDPGAPSCSLLIERVYAPASLRMPPGRTLADAERCALVQWVASGAPR
jgi:hypothetical protein